MAKLAATSPTTAETIEWRVKIDYLSATTGELHVPVPISNKDNRTYSTNGSTACRAASLMSLVGDRGDVWKDASGRSGYAISSAHEIGARVFFGHEKAPPLIELGGSACDTVQAAGELYPFISRNTEGITRIDLAADILTALSPSAFVAAGRSARHKSVSHIKSDRGETVYIGSPKSERRLRVYRYHFPHPRAAYLRVEVMCRDDLARDVATDILINGTAEAWRAAVEPYGLEHDLIYAFRTDRRIERTLRNEPTAAGKLAWIHNQVVPALKKAIASGLVTQQQILDLLIAE